MQRLIPNIRHPDESRDPDFPYVYRLKAWVPACASAKLKFRWDDGRKGPDFPHVRWLQVWVPAFAGMTEEGALATGVKKV